jgi:hypothetical protein
MAIYAAVRKQTDQWGIVEDVIDMGSHVPEAAPPDYWLDITGYVPAPVAGQAWWYDFQGDVFTQTDPGLPVTAPRATPEVLWFERVTDDERGKIFALSQEDGGGITLNMINRGRLKAFLAFSTANNTPLDNDEAIFIFGALEAAGAIDAGRADEILYY